MAFTGFHHGTRLQESTENPVLISLSRSVNVMFGVAPDADPDKVPLNEPVLYSELTDPESDIGTAGDLLDNIDGYSDQVRSTLVIYRFAQGADYAETISNLVGSSASLTGVHALFKAETVLGLRPTGVAIPGYTVGPDNLPSAAVQELKGVLEKLGATAFVTGPATNLADAVAYENNLGGGRVTQIAQMGLVYDTDIDDFVAKPLCGRFLGREALADEQNGIHHSVSNKQLFGIGGVTPVIPLGDQSNLYNEENISLVINEGGFKTWGNRISTDQDLWKFRPVRRVADRINQALLLSFRQFNDRPFSAANVKLMLESGNAAMATFVAQGIILGGRMELEQDLNAPTELAAGKITLSVTFEPPAPMEDIRFLARRDISYYLEVTQAALAA